MKNIFILLILAFVSNLSFAKKVSTDGYLVQFDYEKHLVEREIAYQYLLNTYSILKEDFSNFNKNDIGIDVFDIDNDGRKEIFIYVKNHMLCGSAGCSFEILKQADSQTKAQYISIVSINIYPVQLKVLKSVSSGYYDLLIYEKRGIYIWRWTGEDYDRSKEIKESEWGKGCLYDAWGKKRKNN